MTGVKIVVVMGAVVRRWPDDGIVGQTLLVEVAAESFKVALDPAKPIDWRLPNEPFRLFMGLPSVRIHKTAGDE